MDRLLKSREQLLLLLNAIADGVIAHDKLGKIIYANEAAARTLEYPSAESLFILSFNDVMRQFEITNEAGETILFDSLPGLMALHGIHPPETTLCFRATATRHEHWVVLKTRPAFNASGEVEFVVNILQDISQIKKAEQARRESQRRLQAVFDNTQDAILLADDDAHLVDANEAALSLTGYTRQELLQRRVWDIASDSHEVVNKVLWDEFSSNHHQNGEFSVRRKDGSEVEVEYRAVANIVPGLHLSVLHDITERKLTEQQRITMLEQEREARLKAEEANEVKLKFLAMISHELRTPLTSIKGFASTLLAKDVNWDTDSQAEFLEIIDQEANKLTDLVEQLLDVSRLHAHNLRINPVMQRLSEAVNTAVPQLQHIAARHHFVLDIPPDLPLTTFDTLRIAQVIVNLVDNAAKYSPPGTSIHLYADQIDHHLQVTVSDQGMGIPPEYRQTVFEAFQQLDRPGGAHKGAGLGLAICKGLIEAHGGRIWIDNQPTPGTTIRFTLPIVSANGVHQ
jgi:PAS domain S-box-containing protein